MNLIGRNLIRLYRDDELAAINNSSELTLDFICNEQEYEKVKPLYASPLNESGYKTTMIHTKETNNRNRARNII